MKKGEQNNERIITESDVKGKLLCIAFSSIMTDHIFQQVEQAFVRSESCRRGKKQLFMRMMIGEQLLKKRGMRDLMLV